MLLMTKVYSDGGTDDGDVGDSDVDVTSPFAAHPQHRRPSVEAARTKPPQRPLRHSEA